MLWTLTLWTAVCIFVKCRPCVYRYFLNFATQSTLSCIWQNIPIYTTQLTLKQVCQTSRRPWVIDQIPEKNIPNKCSVCFPFADAAAVGWNPKWSQKNKQWIQKTMLNKTKHQWAFAIWAVTTQLEMLCLSCLHGHTVTRVLKKSSLWEGIWKTFCGLKQHLLVDKNPKNMDMALI